MDETPIEASAALPSDPYSKFNWDNRHDYPAFSWDGRRDRNGRITGEGVLRFENGDEITAFFRGGMREGVGGAVTTADIRLTGTFRNSLLQGPGQLTFLATGDRIDGHFRDSCLHGLARRLDEEGRVSFVGRYRNGRPYGFCWKMTEYAGFALYVNFCLIHYLYLQWRGLPAR